MPRPQHLPLEVLQTFVALAELDGDASAVADKLNIGQPSVSKRLTALRHLTSDRGGEAWLRLEGKRWRLTTEGLRVHGIVADLVHRYDQMERLVATDRASKPTISIACGQQAAGGFVRIAIERFLKEHPNCQVRLTTPRGKDRIAGVAGGQFDLAIVTDSLATIQIIARREMFVETLFEDRFVLVANPPTKSAWGKTWRELPADRPIGAAALLEMPFILPEADASRRQQFDEWWFRATGQTCDIVLETGGWQTILEFAAAGLGVGMVTQSAAKAFRGPGKFTTRLLDESEFQPDAVRLIARKTHGKGEPELTELGQSLRRFLHDRSDV